MSSHFLKKTLISCVSLVAFVGLSGCGNDQQVASNQVDVNAELEAARQADEFCQWVSQFNTNVSELNSKFIENNGDVSLEEYGKLYETYQDGANRLNAAGYKTVGDFSQTMADLYNILKMEQEGSENTSGKSVSEVTFQVLTKVETIDPDVQLIESRCGVKLSSDTPTEETPPEETGDIP